LLEIIFFFMLGRPSSRNNANAVSALGVNNKHDHVAGCHPDKDETAFAVILTVIHTLYREHISKYRFCQLKTNSMEPQVRLRFILIPFEFQIPMLRDSSSFFNAQGIQHVERVDNHLWEC